MTTSQQIKKAVEPIVIRENNACNSFYEVVMNKINCNRNEAVKILNVYIKAKVAKINIHVGHVDVKHGVFFEAEVLMNALNS
jgi:hypothetical protein